MYYTDFVLFQTGDVITILNKEGEEWLSGQLRGKKGIFPGMLVL